MTTAEHALSGQTIGRFLDWAHRHGWRYAPAPYHLAHFQRFLKSRGVVALPRVDTALLVDYQRQLLASRSATTVRCYLGSVRALWRYLLREGLVDEDVTQGLARLPQDHFIPYLYDAAQLARIERALQAEIGQVHTAARRFCRRTRLAAFGLLRDCGLRVSEACQLDVGDYDHQGRSLRIERTKFFKTRVIPLGHATCDRLEQYLALRRGHLAGADDPQSLLVSMYRRRLDRSALESPFRQLLVGQGFYQGRRRQGRTVFGSTNLHSLRHGFAVRTLERWLREGADVERLLPLLSGYMGHVQVGYTATYLHLTPTLRQLASERFRQLTLPRLDHGGLGGEDEQEV